MSFRSSISYYEAFRLLVTENMIVVQFVVVVTYKQIGVYRGVCSPRFRLTALFPPCHPEQRRNPSKARIEWYEVPFGISVEKVRLQASLFAQNDTASAE